MATRKKAKGKAKPKRKKTPVTKAATRRKTTTVRKTKTFRKKAAKKGGFKDRFAIAWFTPILFLLIEFVPFSADVRKARPATIRVVQVGTSALIAF